VGFVLSAEGFSPAGAQDNDMNAHTTTVRDSLIALSRDIGRPERAPPRGAKAAALISNAR